MALVVSALVLTLVLTACSSSTSTTPTSTTPTSATPTTPTSTSRTATPATGDPTAGTGTADDDAFFVPPSPIPGERPGDLIRSRPLAGAPDGVDAWQVLYRSESVAGDPIAVSGVVFAPTDAGAAGDAPQTVLTWAHGTTGLGDQCAPSKWYGDGGSVELVLAQGVVARGWTFVATDYEGLGTPGVHPFLVGQSEGRGVLDIVRAAAQLDGAGVTVASPVAIFGHSQGGHAALMAGELAATWAPELDIVGTVAGAPPGDIALIESSTAGDATGQLSADGFSLMIDAGFLAAYPELPVDAIVTMEGRAALAAVGGACTDGAFELAETFAGTQLDATGDPAWAEVFAANSPGAIAPSAPVLILHGDADDVVPPQLSEQIARSYCALGVTVQRTVYPGADHTGIVLQGLFEAIQWVDDRLAGSPAPTNC